MNWYVEINNDEGTVDKAETEQFAKNLGITLLDDLGDALWLVTLPAPLQEALECDGWLQLRCQNTWLSAELDS